MTSSPPHRRAAARPRRRVPWTALLGVVLVLVAGGFTGWQVYVAEVAQERGDCQSRVNSQLVEALGVRDRANSMISDAQRDVVATRIQSPSETARRDADRRYLVALDNLARARASNPIPTVVPPC